MRFDREHLATAREIIARYPVPKSALIPLLHLSQEQNGYVTDEGMAHIAELLDLSPAEVLGTCSFYEMFKREPVGTYQVNVCTDIACLLTGGPELLEHAEESLGVAAGGTTDDGAITLEGVECIAACTEAPCLQANYRYFTNLTNEDFDRLVDDLRSGRLADEVPTHGTLARIRQHIPHDKAAGLAAPDGGEAPAWMPTPDGEAAADGDAA